MERFYYNQALTGNAVLLTDPEIIHKIVSVLRLKRGNRIIIFDTAQKEFLVEITEVNKKTVGAGIVEERQPKSEPNIDLILFPSLFKKNRFEWMLEKCTEIGVSEFRPIITKRSMVKSETTPERWQKIILEAIQQSGRVKIPKLFAADNLSDALKNLSGKIMVADENSKLSDLSEISVLKESDKRINLFIGPEGGWDDQELNQFKKCGATFLNLGSRILRAETACLIFSAFCIYK